MKKNDKTNNKNNKNINLNKQNYDYLLKDEMWDLLSAYVDGELSVEESYLVITQLDKDETYQKAYEELVKLKKLLGSLARINVSDSFDETLYRKINELKNNENEESINSKEDEQWEAVSAYVDGELPPELRYEVLKKINTVSEYKKIYNEIIKVKNTLGSFEKHQVSKDFDKKLFDKINEIKTSEKNTTETDNIIQFDEFKEQQKKKETTSDFGKILRRVGVSLSAAAVIVIVFIFAIRYNLNNYQDEKNIEMTDETTDTDSSLERGMAAKTSIEEKEYKISNNKDEKKETLNDFAEFDEEKTESIVKADSLDNSGEQIESTKTIILGPDEANAVYNMGNRVYMKNKAEKADKGTVVKVQEDKSNEEKTLHNERDIRAVLLLNVIKDFNFDTDELLQIHKTNTELFNNKIIKKQSSDITNQIKIMSRTVSNEKE